ncbi:MAG: histidine phosphatase family protein [Nocardioidaceae bacterium]|nr:histidine phosphatase family protein [Nocardioidaceae bacterium]
MQRRQLILVRHAKAESFARADVERVLSADGLQDAALLGQLLADDGVRPDQARVSSAARTRETWVQVAHGGGWHLEPSYEAALYGIDEFGLVELLREVSAETRSVLILGHNPTMENAARLLDDGRGPAAGALARGTFPTATAAIFNIDSGWNQIGEAMGRLESLQVARAAG